MTLITEQTARRQLEEQRTRLRRRLGLLPPGQHSRGRALRAHTHALLEQIEQALRQLERGCYGVCESCGGLIRAERLAAWPYLTRCQGCSRPAAPSPA